MSSRPEQPLQARQGDAGLPVVQSATGAYLRSNVPRGVGLRAAAPPASSGGHTVDMAVEAHDIQLTVKSLAEGGENVGRVEGLTSSLDSLPVSQLDLHMPPQRSPYTYRPRREGTSRPR